MATQNQQLHLVFTVHDPRLDDEKSCVYVGITHRTDLNQCMTAVFREHLPELSAELAKANMTAKVKTSGGRMDKESALRRKAQTIIKYRSTGSKVSNSHGGSGHMFTIVTDSELDADSGLSNESTRLAA